jgi:hypothetical protein
LRGPGAPPCEHLLRLAPDDSVSELPGGGHLHYHHAVRTTRRGECSGGTRGPDAPRCEAATLIGPEASLRRAWALFSINSTRSDGRVVGRHQPVTRPPAQGVPTTRRGECPGGTRGPDAPRCDGRRGTRPAFVNSGGLLRRPTVSYDSVSELPGRGRLAQRREAVPTIRRGECPKATRGAHAPPCEPRLAILISSERSPRRAPYEGLGST